MSESQADPFDKYFSKPQGIKGWRKPMVVMDPTLKKQVLEADSEKLGREFKKLGLW
jgi:hypothetical protein